MPVGENQARMVALDPGVRNFLAFFFSRQASLESTILGGWYGSANTWTT